MFWCNCLESEFSGSRYACSGCRFMAFILLKRYLCLFVLFASSSGISVIFRLELHCFFVSVIFLLMLWKYLLLFYSIFFMSLGISLDPFRTLSVFFTVLIFFLVIFGCLFHFSCFPSISFLSSVHACFIIHSCFTRFSWSSQISTL